MKEPRTVPRAMEAAEAVLMTMATVLRPASSVAMIPGRTGSAGDPPAMPVVLAVLRLEKVLAALTLTVQAASGWRPTLC